METPIKSESIRRGMRIAGFLFSAFAFVYYLHNYKIDRDFSYGQDTNQLESLTSLAISNSKERNQEHIIQSININFNPYKD